MSAGAFPLISRKFAFDPTVLAADIAASIEFASSGDPALLQAIARNEPFPGGHNGALALGDMRLAAGSAEAVEFKAGRTKASVAFGIGAATGAGVYDEPKKALRALGLEDAGDLDLGFVDDETTRFLALHAAYKANAAVSGSHPIGAVGSFTFGAKAAASGLTAVLHRFDETTGAATAIGAAVSSWRLPRHSGDSTPGAGLTMAPRTWLIAEADASVAVKVGAKLGYDFSYIRELRGGGLSGDIGLKIDAALSATLGFGVSGRYVVVVGREDEAETLRVRLFKLRRKGVSLGLNLKAGVQGVDTFTPGQADDLVKAVFGMHGEQVVAALAKIEEWTDENKSIGALVAGLTHDKAFELLEAATGIDPAQAKTAFEAARGKLVEAIGLWEGLPERAQSEMLGLLRGMDEAKRDELLVVVRGLASDDDDLVRGALERALGGANFAEQPGGRLLLAFADRVDGALVNTAEFERVRKYAKSVQAILDGDVLRKAQTWIVDKLDLQKALDAVTKTDFDALDEFLRGRLEAFFEGKLDSAKKIAEARKTIGAVVRLRDEIYGKGREAFRKRYSVEIGAAWEKTTGKTALIDATFDLADPAARGLLTEVLQQGKYDNLIARPMDSVTLRAAVLTHEITRRRRVDVALPAMKFSTSNANESFAKLAVEQDGGRLLVYEAKAKDEVGNTRRRYLSSLSVSITAGVAAGSGVRVRAREAASWRHELRLARPDMRRKELEYYTRPFIDRYMRETLPNPDDWYRDLDETVEVLLENGPETFGDVLASFEVTIPGGALQRWLAPVADIDAACGRLSRAIQRELKEIVPFYYLQDPKRLRRNESSAALLVWAAMPPTTSIRKAGSSQYVFDDRPKKTMWDFPSPELRRVMAERAKANLRVEFVTLRQRLSQAGLTAIEKQFADSEVGEFPKLALGQTGDTLLKGLLTFEALVVEKAISAFKAAQKFQANAASAPTKAVEELANFGADITEAFNDKLGATPYNAPALRSGAQLVFVAATRALAPEADPIEAKGTMTLTVLTNAPGRAFKLDDFLKDKFPGENEIVWP